MAEKRLSTNDSWNCPTHSDAMTKPAVGEFRRQPDAAETYIKGDEETYFSCF